MKTMMMVALMAGAAFAQDFQSRERIENFLVKPGTPRVQVNSVVDRGTDRLVREFRGNAGGLNREMRRFYNEWKEQTAPHLEYAAYLRYVAAKRAMEFLRRR